MGGVDYGGHFLIFMETSSVIDVSKDIKWIIRFLVKENAAEVQQKY